MSRRIVLALALLIGVFTLGGCPGGDGASTPAPARAAPGDAQLYTCGMHPNVIQEGPGTCPICGMDLTPMRRGGEGADPGITIDPVTVQNMGIRVAEAKLGEVWRNIRTVGEVQTAEDRLSVVNLRFSGWVERLYVEETGQRVKAGQPLFEIYSPEIVAAQEEYVLALKAGGEGGPLAQSARRRLELWGLPDAHLRAVAKALDGSLRVTLPAPASGYVLHKAIAQGGRVMAGQDLYRIGDLGEVWVEAEVYPFDAPYVKEGQEATIELPYDPKGRAAATVAYVYPTLDPRTRTLRVRLVLPNPEGALRPGMFSTVRLKAEPREGIVVPSEAILNTGERHILFVSPTLGHYEAREVSLGLVGDNGLTQIVSGVRVGEQVVTSGQFLLDSEAQLQEAVQKMLTSRLQRPIPEDITYVCPLHPARIEAEEAGICPIDGLALEPRRGAATP